MKRNGKIGKALSVMIVIMMLITPLFIVGNSYAAEDGSPAPKSGIDLDIDGTFVIDENTVDPISGNTGMYGQDGNITVHAGGKLIVRNATLYFLQDNGDDGIEGTADDNHYHLTVESGGEFILMNSTLTTVDWAVNPYLQLPVTINGKAVFTGATVRYPGTFTVDNGVLYANNTVFSGIKDISDAIEDKDANDDCPLMRFVDSHVVFADSRIEDYYTYTSNTITVDMIPASKGAQDNTGEDVANLSAEDGRNYTVGVGEQMYLDSFTGNLPSWANARTPVSSVILYVSWGRNDTYNGTSPIYVGKDGSTPINTGIVPDNIPVSAASSELPADEFRTISDVEAMDLSFTHNGNSGEMPFDHIWLNVSLVRTYNISVTGGDLYAINTYFDVDYRKFSDPASDGTKDFISAMNGAQLRFYNVTVNDAETAGAHDDFAFIAYDTSRIFLYGWANIATYDGSTTDPTPVPYCRVDSDYYAPSDEGQRITEENNTLHNGDPVLEYMDRMSPRAIDESNYNITDEEGRLSLPLLKNVIMSGDLNGQFLGNYLVTAYEHIHGTNTSRQVTFRPYPNMSWEDNSFSSDFKFSWTYPPRDLSVSPSDIAVSPDPVVRGDEVSFDVTVHNIGGINVTSPFTVSLLVDGQMTDEAVVNSSVERNGGTVHALLKWATEFGDYGLHNITVVVDSASEILDGDRSNNNATIFLSVGALYDLSIDPSTIWWENTTYGNTYTDTELTIHATVVNSGAGDISGDINVNFYVNGVGIERKTISGMLSGASVELTTTYTTSNPGDYNVSVTVGLPQNIHDDIPSNNHAYRILNTLPVPDLVVIGMDVPSSGIEGFNSTISATVMNDGDTYANGTISATFKDDTTGAVIGTATYTGLLVPGATAELSVVWRPTEPAGEHHFSVMVSFINATGEPPETVVDNNGYSSMDSMVVELAYDLSISDTDIMWNPSAPMTYENITVSAEIHNTGLRDINTSFTVRFDIGGMPYYADVSGVNAGESVIASVTFSTTASGTYSVIVTVDYTDAIPEYDENNNRAMANMYVGPRPEFSIMKVYVEGGIGDSSVVDDHNLNISADIVNTGASATGTLSVYFYDGNPDSGGAQIGYVAFSDPSSGWKSTATITWRAAGVGNHEIYVRLVADTTPPEGNTADNTGWTEVSVLPRPDLTITGITFIKATGEISNTSESRDFDINITVVNQGGLLSDSRVDNFTLSVFNGIPMAGDWSNLLGNISINGTQVSQLDAGEAVYCVMTVERFTLMPGLADIYAVVDSGNAVDEGNEDNNMANRTIEVFQMRLRVTISSPMDSTDINMEKQKTVTVVGQLIDIADGQPVDHIPVTVSLVDASTGAVSSSTQDITWINNRHMFRATLSLGSPGDYRIQVSATTPDGETVAVQQSGVEFGATRPTEESSMLWLAILIIVIVVLAAVGGTIFYLKTKYAGKYVECGSCGRMIPAGSDKCPYCGAVFDKETVKCSSCGAWIPADATECPKCGAKFLVGGKEIVDYETQMKKQYEEFVEKFRKQARKEMGDEFSEEKFQQWWRTQKSYVTFEDWLKREEERKKTGGIICPVCGALNSKTDIVCHVCGSPLRSSKKKKSEGEEVESEGLSTIELPSLDKKEEEKEAEEEKPGEEEAPEKTEEKTEEQPSAEKKVVKKVVKKKVVKKEAEPSGDAGEKKVAELPPDMIAGVKKDEEKKPDEEKPAPSEAPADKPPMKKKVVKKVVKKKVVKK